MTSQIIFKNEHCCIEYFFDHKNPKNDVACVFSSGGNRNLDGNHFGGNFLLNNGFDVIAIKIDNDDWFQSISKNALSKVEQLISEKLYIKRVGMGSSMGGYGAIAFSKLLQLDLVLAYSPQYRIDEDFDSRWKSNASCIKWNYPITKDTISSSCEFFIIYDDKNLDGVQFRHLQSIINPEKIFSKAVSYSGHCSAIYLHETGFLKDITLQILKYKRLNTLNLKINRHRSLSCMTNLYHELARRNKERYSRLITNIILSTNPHGHGLPIGARKSGLQKNIQNPIKLIISFYKNLQLVRPLYESLLNCKSELKALKIVVYFYIDSPDDEQLFKEIQNCVNENLIDIRIIENRENLGFIRTVNQGLQAAISAKNDVIILNSDTQIFPGAFTEMVRVAALDPMIGFVSPRSNDATLCTFPHDASKIEALPSEHFNRHQEIAKHLSDFSYAPTAVGFCLFIKWTVLSEFGGFDSIYGHGYNEENDLIMRANRSGFRAALANKAFVYHIGEATLSDHSPGRDRLEKNNNKLLLARYPHYEKLVHNYYESPEYRAEQLLTPLVNSNETKICFDFSSFGTYHNGTFEAGLATLKAASSLWPVNIQIIVCMSKDAWEFHKLTAINRLRRIDVHQPNENFAAVIKYGQPFSADCISRVLSRAPVATFFMLDTIAADCGQLSVNLDENLWRFVMNWSDAVYTNSRFSAHQLTRRYGLGPRTNLLPISHSMDPADYRDPLNVGSINSRVVDSLNLKDSLLIVGNKFPHKFVDETIKVVSHELPHLSFIVLGSASKRFANVQYIEAGSLSSKEVDFIYSSVQAVIFPSQYEGFGFPVMHSLARHKPIYLRLLPPFEEIAHSFEEGHENLHWFDSTHRLIELLRLGVANWSGNKVTGESLGWHRTANDILATLIPKIKQVEHVHVANRMRWFELSFCRSNDFEGRHVNSGHYLQLVNQISELTYLVSAFRASNSWKVTSPFRRIKDLYLFLKNRLAS